MTSPEQRANIIIEKYLQIAPETFGTDRALEYATYCSIVATDLILELDVFLLEDREYWLEVKKYLEQKYQKLFFN